MQIDLPGMRSRQIAEVQDMSSNASEGKAMVPRVGVASLSSPLEVGAERAPETANALSLLLAEAGCDVVELGPIDNSDAAVLAGQRLAGARVDAVALAPVSWFEDYLALDVLEECCVPTLFWSLPGIQTGSLCGTQQVTCYLKQLGVPYECVFGLIEPGGEILSRAMAFLRAAALKSRLRRARVGLGGHRVAGMTEVAVNEIALKKAIGPRIVPLDLPQLLARADEMPADQASALWRDVVARSGACKVADEVGHDSLRVYLAIRELIDQHGLDALAIGCYPHLMGRVCLAASLLADEGVPLACEGDANGAVAQLILTQLTGEPTHNTDWLDPMDDGTIVFSHCGNGSFSLAENPDKIRLATVRLMDQGVCAQFPAKPGQVTLLNLMPTRDGYQCALLEGHAVSTEMVFPGNPLRVQFEYAPGELIDWGYAEGVGHHWIIGYSHVGDAVRNWAKIVGGSVRLIEP